MSTNPIRVFVSFCLFFILIANPVVAAEHPNIVLILADDQGWNGLSVKMNPADPGSGSSYYQTPRLAKLAREGMRFSRAYSPAPTCSPTRHSIQFGRSPTSLRIFGADKIARFDAENKEALAHVLKAIEADYVCAHLGKWHISRSPKALGFDVSDGNTINRHGNSKDPADPKRIFDLSRRANIFMEEQVGKGKPFFLQISHYADHLAYQARAETIRKYETKYANRATAYHNQPLWAAMNEDLDTGIGMVLDKINQLGIAENTYVIYTADNGYELKKDFGKPVHERGYYKAFPQRSHKYHLNEGGIRVPFIVRGPDITANTHSTTPVMGTDIFSTVMELAGGSEKAPKRVEGASLIGHLTSGGKQAIVRKDPFFVFKYSKPKLSHDIAIVQDDYKLIKDIDTGRMFLFDLKKDVGESCNLFGKETKRADRMYSDMTAYFQRFGWDESRAKSEKDKKRKKGKKSKRDQRK